MKEHILNQLSDSYPWKAHFHWFDEIDSTNVRIKAMAKELM